LKINIFIAKDYYSNEVDFNINQNMSDVKNSNKNVFNEMSSSIIRDKSPISNLNNSDFNLNNTNIEDDIMAKINKEAQKFEDNIISGEDIYDRYDKVSENQFKEMIKDKKYK
jgi:hypothetical protein